MNLTVVNGVCLGLVFGGMFLVLIGERLMKKNRDLAMMIIGIGGAMFLVGTIVGANVTS